ncbi:hypothetical protein E2562_025621 [Oryza meyeriana var. granulata]|uniref:RING-type E3 ubiquitin transferase n=1 Tax=Oryza meyeriana var. granulata TaxID=110450 RepID=A0A6G1FCH2_9ORYZ|nr:hypothetical protein E2562_025621 [Oryza meyeriana var. granulata]
MRALLHSTAGTDLPASPPPPAAISIDSDMVVILASLLCALICVAGLALRKAIDALPTVSFAAGASGKQQQQAAECAICLAEFAAGEELRVLPHCGHGFHVACIDTWLGAHATCPSCRAAVGTPPTLFLPGRCRRCGEVGDVATLEAAHFSSSSAGNGEDDT